MTKASDNPFPSILLEDHADPTAPADGFKRLFVDTDEKLKMIDHASLVTDFTPAAGGDVATDAIWDAAGDLAVGTGANTAGRLAKGAAGGVLAMGNSAVIWNAGTSFPGSKAAGDRYWRTDLGLEFYWDGTRWVTAQLFRTGPGITVNNWVSTTAGYVFLWPIDQTFNGMWVVGADFNTYIATTNDGSKYWTITLRSGDTDEAQTNLGNFTTAADTVNKWVKHTITVGAVLGGTATYINAASTKTSTPGTIYVGATLIYRLIAT